MGQHTLEWPLLDGCRSTSSASFESANLVSTRPWEGACHNMPRWFSVPGVCGGWLAAHPLTAILGKPLE